MYYFCTYFDINYMTRGLAMYESLKNNCKTPFILWVLCFDDESLHCLKELNQPDIRVISQSEFEQGDLELQAAKSTRSRVEYFWSCTASLPLFVFSKNPMVGIISYIDADLFFFGDLKPIYDEMGSRSILIHEHRYAPEYAAMRERSGRFNVGLVMFRRDENGLACLQKWRSQCLEWCHAYFEDGKFGDQLYLDNWPDQFSGVVILQHIGAGAGPWNISQYQLNSTESGLWLDGQQLIFYHFHAFKIVTPNIFGSHFVLSLDALNAIYFPYFECLKTIALRLARPVEDKLEKQSTTELLSGLANQDLYLKRSRRFSTWIYTFGGWNRKNNDRVEVGFKAHANGDLVIMRREFLQAIVRNPFVLKNLGMIPRLLESYVGESAMRPYWNWRHKRFKRKNSQ